MIQGSRPRTIMRHRARHVLLAITLVCVCSLQGCASSLETLGLGVGLGVAGAVGMITCAITCH